MATPSAGPESPTNLGMAPNVAGLLCYVPCCVGLIFSIVAAIVEKQNRFVRFHAFQSLLLHGAWLVVAIGLLVVQVVLGAISGLLALLPWLLSLLLSFGVLGIAIFMMVKAHTGEEYELPVIGAQARQWV